MIECCCLRFFQRIAFAPLGAYVGVGSSVGRDGCTNQCFVPHPQLNITYQAVSSSPNQLPKPYDPTIHHSQYLHSTRTFEIVVVASPVWQANKGGLIEALVCMPHFAVDPIPKRVPLAPLECPILQRSLLVRI